MIQDRRGTEALVRDEVADFALPDYFSIQIERGSVDRTLVQKIDEQPAAITRDCGRGGGGVRLFSGVRLAAMHLGLPEQFSCVAFETEHGLVGFGAVGCRKVDAVAYDGGRSMSGSRYLCPPDNVVGFVPFHRRGLAGRCDAVSSWPAPLWPVGGGIWGKDCRTGGVGSGDCPQENREHNGEDLDSPSWRRDNESDFEFLENRLK